jgi:hypothetical protein
MSEVREVTIRDFLTDKQIRQAIGLYREYRGTSALHDMLVQKVIRPNMAAINRKLGQENDESYMAYAVEHAISVFEEWRRS